jgi:hypothetical protein
VIEQDDHVVVFTDTADIERATELL